MAVDAAEYYFNQVRDTLTGAPSQGPAGRLAGVVEHKIRIVRLIELDPSRDRVAEVLHYHPVTTNGRKYSVEDLPALALRLTAEAEDELDLMLAHVSPAADHRLLIYPFRPEPAARARPAPRRPVRRARAPRRARRRRSAGHEPMPS